MAEPRVFVFDSSVLLLYVAGDNRVEALVNRVNDGINKGYMLEPCVSEIYTKINEKFGIDEANKVLEAIKNSKIQVIDVNYELMRDAGELKSTYKSKLSMIAAYMITLAKSLNAVLVTSDEFIAKTNEVKVELVKVRA
jgi:predicted nucleic acid-binding protein